MIHQAKSSRPLLDEQIFSERLASESSAFGKSSAAPRILVRYAKATMAVINAKKAAPVLGAAKI
jgi:hypothetical protein